MQQFEGADLTAKQVDSPPLPACGGLQMGPKPLRSHRLAQIVCIVCTAALVRIVALFLIPHGNIWASTAEMANVAKAVAQGEGFSSPFGPSSGPTAWVPPVYPLLLAGIFKLFGIFSARSALVVFLFQIAISTLTCIPIVHLGDLLGNEDLGLWAGWGWACYPYFVLLPVLFIWETALSALLATVLLLMTARLRGDARLSRWSLYGVIWGFAALTNTALLMLIPAFAGWLWWEKRPRRDFRWITGALVAILLCLLVVAPWSWRNWQRFHTFIPLRSNFGEELWLGNHKGGSGRIHYGDNAYENPRELQRFQQLGEIAYVRAKQRTALYYIVSDPADFLHNVLFRLLYWWVAVGEHAPIFWLYAALGVISLVGVTVIFWSRASKWYVVAFSILVFPIIYYVSDVIARYRHAVEPAMLLASTYFVYWVAGERGQLYRRKEKASATD